VAAVVVAVSIGTPLLGLRVFHATDLLLDRYPWREAPPGFTSATNDIVGDTVTTFMPYHTEFRRRVGSADFPLWTPYPGGGLPLGSVPDAGTLGPLNLPYLVVPLWFAPGVAKLLEMAVAIGFTALFVRRLGLEWSSALVGGLVFAFSGYQVVWTNFPQSHVGALIPALFWAVERGLQKQDLRGVLPLVPVAAAMVLEGFPSVTGYALLAAGGYALVRVGAERGVGVWPRVRVLLLLGGAIAIGIGLTAAQVLPFAERTARLDLAYRVQPPGAHLPPFTAATMAVPDAFGSPVEGTYWGPLNYVEVQAFVGASALALVVAAAAWGLGRTIPRGARGAAWGIVAVAGVVLYAGGPLLTALQLTPLFRLNLITRLRSVLGFALAVVAALGLQALADRRGRRGIRATVAWAVAAVAAVYGAVRLWTLAGGAGTREDLTAEAVLPLAVGSVAVMAAWLPSRLRVMGRPAAMWVLPVLFGVEALAFAIPFWPRIPRQEFYPATAVHQMLDRRLGHDRFLGAGGAMAPGTATFFGLRSLTTNNTLPQLPGWEDMIRAVDPDAYGGSPVNPIVAARTRTLTSTVLDRMAVTYAVAPPTTPVIGRRVVVERAGGGTLTLPAGVPLRVPVPGGQVRAAIVELAAAPEVAGEARLVARFLAGGAVVAEGTQRVYPGTAGGPVQVPVVEPRCDPCPARMELDLRLEAQSGAALLRAGAGGAPAVTVVVAGEDRLRVDLVANAVVYRRLGALPRIRWAGRARLVQASSDRLRALAGGVPGDEVLLSGPGPPGSGQGAELDVLSDGGDEIRLSVTSGGDGYVVVADPLLPGWEASVDGRPTALRVADHGLAAVFVPMGTHRVVLRYDPPGWGPGLVISAASAVILLAFTVFSVVRRRTSTRTAPHAMLSGAMGSRDGAPS
jgi:hypothetical protein